MNNLWKENRVHILSRSEAIIKSHEILTNTSKYNIIICATFEFMSARKSLKCINRCACANENNNKKKKMVVNVLPNRQIH